jgi:hypothetical protein
MKRQEKVKKRLAYRVKGENVGYERSLTEAKKAALDFEETGNPVFAMQAFVSAKCLGISVPESVDQWVVDCFLKCLESGGAESLERVMGLVVRKGQTSPFEAVRRQMRDLKVFSRMAQLVCHGVGKAEAAGMVRALFCWHLDHDGPALGSEVLSVETIIKEYSKWEKREVFEEIYRAQVLPLLTGDKLSVLFAEYPAGSIPDRFKPLIR